MNKTLTPPLKSVSVSALTFRVNTKEAAVNVMNFQRLRGKTAATHPNCLKSVTIESIYFHFTSNNDK